MDWREAAVAEIVGLKPHWVSKYGWKVCHVEHDEGVDLFVSMTSRRLAGREFLLRLRYHEDWQIVGRREAFVAPEPPHDEGVAHWPPENAIRGVNPNYRRDTQVIPCICIRGVWGYHSVLHTNARMDGATLLSFLVELQEAFDE